MQNSPARTTIDVGSVIAGTYTIEALIGRGGMGAVFLASHSRLPGKKVAIKVLHAEMQGDEILARFKREAQIASMLSHPNIVHIEDYNITADGMPYLVLEYLEGESLAQRLKAGPLSVEQAFSIIRQVGSALAAAHLKGIVHRDLKPQNIFLSPSEIEGRTLEIAKVLDFGISKMRDSQTVKTQDSALLGTPQYMAPEQATGQHSSVDERTDVFALGAIVYEMLAGHPAFSGASIPEVVFKVVYEQPAELAKEVPSLPAAIAAAVHRAMSKPATDRFSTVSEFIAALTGQPLAPPRGANSIPPPDPAFATGSRAPGKDSGKEAFANTMGSGEHGPSPIAPVATAVAPSVEASAPTVSSQSGSPVPRVSLTSGTAETISQSGTASTPVPTAATPAPVARPIGKFVVGGVVIAALAAAAMYFAMRQPHHARVADTDKREQREEKREQRIEERQALHETTPPIVAVVPVDAAGAAEIVVAPGSGAGSQAAKKIDTKKTDPKKIVATKESTPDVDDVSGDASAAQKLQEADAALRDSQWVRAEQLANAVINSDDSGPNQKMRAVLIHGQVQCLGRNNEEAALTDLRKIRAPVVRRRLLAACHKAGYLGGEQQ